MEALPIILTLAFYGACALLLAPFAWVIADAWGRR